ncbi:hypothetical protein [Halomonas maura]|uniref:hypothetical protein n=1 Tax=Halomonas maura TaxID=117606 RepID=UPI0025B2AFA6|nr:hypothetical protein [Halomonas maura]MDN3554961.1 hypothetical protein [Halomonas maura]
MQETTEPSEADVPVRLPLTGDPVTVEISPSAILLAQVVVHAWVIHLAVYFQKSVELPEEPLGQDTLLPQMMDTWPHGGIRHALDGRIDGDGIKHGLTIVGDIPKCLIGPRRPLEKAVDVPQMLQPDGRASSLAFGKQDGDSAWLNPCKGSRAAIGTRNRSRRLTFCWS